MGNGKKNSGKPAKSTKKASIRKQIIDAAAVYGSDLAGKVFLYVFGDDYFQVNFKTESFSHLTGVLTQLSAVDFYQKAKNAKLTDGQFYFNPPTHPMGMAKKKLPSLKRLPELTTSMVIILKDMSTKTLMYKLGLTNLELTLGLTENIDSQGNKVDDLLIPRTLRAEKTSVEKSEDGDIVDFIFMRDASKKLYDVMTFADENKTIPASIESLIEPKFYQPEDDEEE